MKERLGWFAARGRLRLQRSFGSSDNLVGSNKKLFTEGIHNLFEGFNVEFLPNVFKIVFEGADERRFTKKQGPAYLGAQSSQRQSRVKKITTDK